MLQAVAHVVSKGRPERLPQSNDAMNRESALIALQTINAKVCISTQSEASPEIIETLERASKELVGAVQGDAYARERTNVILAYLHAGFLGGTSKPISHRQDILEGVKALYSYISRRPDPL